MIANKTSMKNFISLFHLLKLIKNKAVINIAINIAIAAFLLFFFIMNSTR